MKVLVVAFSLLFLISSAQAETLVQTFSGKLRGTDTQDVHSLDLQRGEYRYELVLSGDKRARARIRVSKRRLSGIPVELVDAKKLKSGRTHTGTFNVEVRGVVGQNTQGTRETKLKVSKKAGPRTIEYTLKVYKL